MQIFNNNNNNIILFKCLVALAPYTPKMCYFLTYLQPLYNFNCKLKKVFCDGTLHIISSEVALLCLFECLLFSTKNIYCRFLHEFLKHQTQEQHLDQSQLSRARYRRATSSLPGANRGKTGSAGLDGSVPVRNSPAMPSEPHTIKTHNTVRTAHTPWDEAGSRVFCRARCIKKFYTILMNFLFSFFSERNEVSRSFSGKMGGQESTMNIRYSLLSMRSSYLILLIITFYQKV